jgi:hypothetical protein
MARPQHKPEPQPAPAGLKVVEKVPPQEHAAKNEPEPEAAAPAPKTSVRQKLHPARVWPD